VHLALSSFSWEFCNILSVILLHTSCMTLQGRSDTVLHCYPTTFNLINLLIWLGLYYVSLLMESIQRKKAPTPLISFRLQRNSLF
jgi:hypothetical protein